VTGAAYRVEFMPSAVRQLQRLPEKVSTACLEFCSGPLSRDPWRMGKPLRDPFVGQLSARRGPYRIIYTVNDEAMLISVLKIDHRADIYRGR
jgi:mRNA interferase RelE/StbE